MLKHDKMVAIIQDGCCKNKALEFKFDTLWVPKRSSSKLSTDKEEISV